MTKRFINVFCALRVNKGSDFVEDFTNIDELKNEDSIYFAVLVLQRPFGRKRRGFNCEILNNLINYTLPVQQHIKTTALIEMLVHFISIYVSGFSKIKEIW
jgi:hypothetical protein